MFCSHHLNPITFILSIEIKISISIISNIFSQGTSKVEISSLSLLFISMDFIVYKAYFVSNNYFALLLTFLYTYSISQLCNKPHERTVIFLSKMSQYGAFKMRFTQPRLVWLSWLDCYPIHKKVVGSILCQGTYPRLWDLIPWR